MTGHLSPDLCWTLGLRRTIEVVGLPRSHRSLSSGLGLCLKIALAVPRCTLGPTTRDHPLSALLSHLATSALMEALSRPSMRPGQACEVFLLARPVEVLIVLLYRAGPQRAPRAWSLQPSLFTAGLRPRTFTTSFAVGLARLRISTLPPVNRQKAIPGQEASMRNGQALVLLQFPYPLILLPYLLLEVLYLLHQPGLAPGRSLIQNQTLQ